MKGKRHVASNPDRIYGGCKMKAVGQSSRTPIKHFILNTELGRLVGVLALRDGSVPARLPLLGIDLCGGNGVDNEESGTCSPTIFQKHYKWRGIPSKVIVYEKTPLHFDKLHSRFGGLPDFELRMEDARAFRLDSEVTRFGQAVFINADPNSVADMPISVELARSLTPTTTFVCTLGCNVGGLLRLSQAERSKWYDYVSPLITNVPHWHDVHIYRLLKDSSKWAYLVRMPRVWSEETLRRVLKAGNKHWPGGIAGVSLRNDSKGFGAALDLLFKTKRERDT